ncbi:MAG: hypothetical protein IAF58_10790 [Leptolyngbya sp.]|nr:hypothetical protein [Candidatus Melainabacteria bacterium]
MPNEADTIHITADGSITLKDIETGELFHNRAGAYTEALVNFVQPLYLHKHAVEKQEYAVMDVCFGLGYNTFALLTELAQLPSKIERVQVVAIEKNELPLRHLNDVLNDKRFVPLNDAMKNSCPALFDGEIGKHHFSIVGYGAGGSSSKEIRVEINLIREDLRQVIPRLANDADFIGSFDAIFHDAFSPLRAPYLWTVDLFQCYKRLLKNYQGNNPGGRVVTYSAASAVRSALEQCGFCIRRTEALGAKNGGTLAILTDGEAGIQVGDEALELLEHEVLKMHGRPGVPHRDPTFQDTWKNIQIAREAEQDVLFPVPKVNYSPRRRRRK